MRNKSAWVASFPPAQQSPVKAHWRRWRPREREFIENFRAALVELGSADGSIVSKSVKTGQHLPQRPLPSWTLGIFLELARAARADEDALFLVGRIS
jgi:hypothetical protein